MFGIEERRLHEFRRRRSAQVLVRRRVGDAALAGADDEADLKQVRFDHVSERVAQNPAGVYA